MSLSDPNSSENGRPVPPEVLAIAVALAVELLAAEAAETTAPEPPDPWRWSGRRWERPVGHRWS